jgi:hypothetical protein
LSSIRLNPWSCICFINSNCRIFMRQLPHRGDIKKLKKEKLSNKSRGIIDSKGLEKIDLCYVWRVTCHVSLTTNRIIIDSKGLEKIEISSCR